VGAADGPLRPAAAGHGGAAGWCSTQLALAGALLALAATSRHAQAIRAFALLAVAVAFLSASRRTWSIDAYRTDLLRARPSAASGASLGGDGLPAGDDPLRRHAPLIWTDPAQGGGWTWPQVYRFMALLMAGAAVAVGRAAALPAPCRPCPLAAAPPPARARPAGFLRAAGRGPPASGGHRARCWAAARDRCAMLRAAAGACQQHVPAPLQKRWVDLAGAAAGHRPRRCRWRPGRRAAPRFDDPASAGLSSYFSPARRGGLPGRSSSSTSSATPSPAALMTPFLLKGMALHARPRWGW
jgi:PAT family beta-lactamase induction signal transducer AmpG